MLWGYIFSIIISGESLSNWATLCLILFWANECFTNGSWKFEEFLVSREWLSECLTKRLLKYSGNSLLTYLKQNSRSCSAHRSDSPRCELPHLWATSVTHLNTVAIAHLAILVHNFDKLYQSIALPFLSTMCLKGCFHICLRQQNFIQSKWSLNQRITFSIRKEISRTKHNDTWRYALLILCLGRLTAENIQGELFCLV